MIEVTIEWWSPNSFREPQGSYWFENLWTDPLDRFKWEENAIVIMKKLVRRVPMGSYFRVIYRCPHKQTETYFEADRRSVVKELERLRDEILSGVPVF